MVSVLRARAGRAMALARTRARDQPLYYTADDWAEHLAQVLGRKSLTRQAVNAWERTGRVPAEALLAAAEILGTTVGQLLGDDVKLTELPS